MGEVAFLWHMHQPDYRDPGTGVPCMPWVRLHTLRGYRDMVLETTEHRTPWTLNWVPVLLDQMLYYAAGGTDRHLDLTRLKPADLTPKQVDEVRLRFVHGHPKMHGVYAHLAGSEGEQDLFDLQVWSTLCWFGSTALRDFPVLEQLRRKARGFVLTDKLAMLSVQQRILREFPQQLRDLAESGASLSTTPYYHPILPLLVDVESAREALPHLPPLPSFTYPQDARNQLVQALNRFEAVLGVRPHGLWPSEGSVSTAVCLLAADVGFSWLCSDDGVLEKSGGDARVAGPWKLPGGCVGLFRDHGLSDRMGFRYASMTAADAAQDLSEAVAGRSDVTVIALDGENPWESYADAGSSLRSALRSRLSLVSLDSVAKREPVGQLQRVHAGSWVDASFAIWIGDEADQRAWRQLAAVRHAAETAQPALRDAAMAHIYRAEGSDWTWWYGGEFDTPFADLFDGHFRALLQAAWVALRLEVPEDLLRADERRRQPSRQLHPSLERDAWVDFWGAGSLPVGGAMAQGEAWVRSIQYGFDEQDALWLRLVVMPGVEVTVTDAEMARHGSVVIARMAAPGRVQLLARRGQATFEWAWSL
jgi:alpha-amylase/alpha-mannosidase (GH57 family)